MNIYLMKKPKRFNAVSVSIGILCLILAYFAWFVVPMFWPVFQLTGIMRGACNDAYRTLDDNVLMKKMLRDAARTKLKLSKENFHLERVRFEPDELREVIKGKADFYGERLQKRGKACILTMHYEDDYTWPLIGKTTHMVFDREVNVTLEQVTWEKSGFQTGNCTCVSARP